MFNCIIVASCLEYNIISLGLSQDTVIFLSFTDLATVTMSVQQVLGSSWKLDTNITVRQTERMRNLIFFFFFFDIAM